MTVDELIECVSKFDAGNVEETSLYARIANYQTKVLIANRVVYMIRDELKRRLGKKMAAKIFYDVDGRIAEENAKCGIEWIHPMIPALRTYEDYKGTPRFLVKHCCNLNEIFEDNMQNCANKSGMEEEMFLDAKYASDEELENL